MLSDKWTVPDDVFLQACKDFEARRKNGGCWVGGATPDSVLKIRALYNLDNQSNWVLTVEGVVGMMAISLVSKLTIADLR